MFCFQYMCIRMEKPLMAKSQDFSHTLCTSHLFQKIAGLKVQIQELEQLLQQTSEDSTPDQSQGSPPASQPRSPASGRAQRSRHRDASRVPRVRYPDSRRVHPEQTPDSTRGPGGQRPDSPDLYPYSHHQALSMRKVLPVRRPVPPMPGLVSDDSDDSDENVEHADADDEKDSPRRTPLVMTLLESQVTPKWSPKLKRKIFRCRRWHRPFTSLYHQPIGSSRMWLFH